MKRFLATGLMLVVMVAASFSQAKISGDITGAYTYGLAAKDQQVASGFTSMYETKKNGYSTTVNFGFDFKPVNFMEVVIRLKAVSRTGSDYLQLESPSLTPSSLGLTVDSFYGRINVLDSLFIETPVDLFVKAGRYNAAASNFQTSSRYGTESVLGMIKSGTVMNFGFELAQASMPMWRSHTLVFQAAANTDMNESFPRLYDKDGSMSTHGKEVLGEYAPSVFASVKLDQYKIFSGLLSAEADYAYNGAGIYSGHSAGLAAKYNTALKSDVMWLQAGAGFAYYEKNIDALSNSAGYVSVLDSTDLRGTLRAGTGIGFKYQSFFRSMTELNLGGAYTSINHIYRNPLLLVSLSVDGKFTYRTKFFAGGGIIAGTLTKETWKTKDDVTSLYDDFNKTYNILENYGFEAYGGVNISPNFIVCLGYNKNRGLAMNYSIESLKDGQRKYYQAGTTGDQGLFETGGVFLKTQIKY